MTRLGTVLMIGLALTGAMGGRVTPTVADPDPSEDTTTPIKHLVVIFQENCSFDHYFGTYPHAANIPGEAGATPFHAKPGTPTINGLSPALLTMNPNFNKLTGLRVNPFRFPPSHQVTGGNTNDMHAEQSAYDGGLMDKFVDFTGQDVNIPGFVLPFPRTDVMGYFDGNTVTALWNYAQHFAMSDNHFGTVSGATILGHINLISGQTHGARWHNKNDGPNTWYSSDLPGVIFQGTIIANANSAHDNWATKAQRVEMTGTNVGKLLNDKGVTWGWFSDGFAPNPDGTPNTTDYGINREPFQLYASTANPNHSAPNSIWNVGYTLDQVDPKHPPDPANHQYDLADFWKAAAIHRIPAVSFFKAKNSETGHPGTDSTPGQEQTFLAHTLNELQKLPEWKDMAVMIGWDDSDGWYDHQMPPIVNQSNTQTAIPPIDALPGLGLDPATIMGPPGSPYQARCGYGPRLPFLVISPYAKCNYVDHVITDQSSVCRFIEDNWNLGRIGDFSFDTRAGSLLGFFDFRRGPRHDRLFLNESTGAVVDHDQGDER
jgi:phospholipase C